MAFVADLELIKFNPDIFKNRRPENYWEYNFKNGHVNEIVFDATLGNHKKAKLVYDDGKLKEVVFDGGFTSQITYEYDPKGNLTKSKEYSILGNTEKTFEQKTDSLIMKNWNEESNQESVQIILFDTQYSNLTFPHASEIYFNELFSVQNYYEDNDYNYEHIKDGCGNTTAILKKFKDYDGVEGTIQQIKYFEINYK
jgi:hypothetical protein